MNNNSNKKFEELIEYIENNICEEISYVKLARILGTSEYTMHRIFTFVTNYNVAEYIRKRRLSLAALDLLHDIKVIDVAVKYGYESSQAFSRAFNQFMRFNPSLIKENENKIKYFPKYELKNESDIEEYSFHIEHDLEFSLFAVQINTTIENCHIDAPKFWKKIENDLKSKHTYGLLKYDKNLDEGNAVYFIAEKEKFNNSRNIIINKCNYLVFDFEFKSPEYLHEYCSKIYRTLIISGKYELADLPDIEEYLEDGSFKLYIPIK